MINVPTANREVQRLNFKDTNFNSLCETSKNQDSALVIITEL